MVSKAHLKKLESIVSLLDSQFRLGPLKFGIDPVLGLIPFLGDLLPTLFSVYMIILAVINKLPKSTIFAMSFYTTLDFFFGNLPIIGDIIDIFFKSHTKNLQLLKRGLKLSPA